MALATWSAMVRLKDVAYLAGYDISTVSKVLNDENFHASAEARSRILKAAEDLGYQPNLLARGLRTHRSGAVLMALPRIDNPVIPALTEGAERAAQKLDQDLLAYKFPLTGGTKPLLRLVTQGRADGILMVDDLPDDDFLVTAKARRVPIVTLNRQEIETVPSVILDDAAGFSVQASYIRGLGHERIVFVAVHPSSRVSQFCQATFLDTCEANGVPLRDDHLLSCKYDGSDAHIAVQQILALKPRPTAVATGSLVMAMRVIQGLVEAGVKVPQEMSVIGYHDSTMGEWSHPKTTTIRMPSVEQGMRGVERLYEMISGQEGAMQEVISTPIMVVERGSCAKAPRR